MKTGKLNSCLILVALATMFAAAGQVQAGVMHYQITVVVTAAPKPESIITDFDWEFGSLPSTYVGTFDFDDTLVGSEISNLQLTIGGVDIAATHTDYVYSSFDPNLMELSFQTAEPNDDFTNYSFLSFGSFGSGGAPSNYAVAMETNSLGTSDPYYNWAQNWVGTFSINSVPEPGSLAIFGTICLVACGRRRHS